MSDDAIEKRMQELRELSEQFAAAYATMNHLDEFKKSKLAMLMKDAERDGVKTTAAQERDARAHRDYLALLDSLKDATERCEALRWKLKLAELGAEIWRTRESTKRAEMMGYGNRR
jgi:hypothetical protein